MSFCTPRVVELHDRALESVSIDTFRPVEHLPSDVELLAVVPGHEDDDEKDSHSRLL